MKLPVIVRKDTMRKLRIEDILTYMVDVLLVEA